MRNDKKSKEVLSVQKDKISVHLERSGNHYRAGWKVNGSDKINWCLGFYETSYYKGRKYPWFQRRKSWTGFRKATKEFFLLADASDHPNIQFITRKK
jgi:hypothetical protein